ncbi:hypothetical protein HX038_16555 [Myroides odoratimimus]|uniref:hypothetical protein n=1 Tax=Myroides TaxID=76831 RepID=UPI0025765C10|nr:MULTISPECIES: hypothetical protein [Myroides]MDM1381927.1 hypothetical protein [Myroides marinus]MDM1412338.1 hypothetical protein [Myroides odoratimimus]MEC4009232.1 hypothetical protein [Myroides odoratimimus]MEC4084622.1 hypothetical protein [Myroides odoratimimus]
MTNFTLIVSILSLIIGFGLIYWINRRKFYRRNVAGLEGFSSFEASVFIRFIERLGKWLAYILILFSVLLFLLYKSEKKRIERKEQKIEIESNRPTTKGN